MAPRVRFCCECKKFIRADGVCSKLIYPAVITQFGKDWVCGNCLPDYKEKKYKEEKRLYRFELREQKRKRRRRRRRIRIARIVVAVSFAYWFLCFWSCLVHDLWGF